MDGAGSNAWRGEVIHRLLVKLTNAFDPRKCSVVTQHHRTVSRNQLWFRECFHSVAESSPLPISQSLSDHLKGLVCFYFCLGRELRGTATGNVKVSNSHEETSLFTSSLSIVPSNFPTLTTPKSLLR